MLAGVLAAAALLLPCGAHATPTSMYAGDTDASTGASNPTNITVSAPHLSWVNSSGSAASGQRVQLLSSPLTDVVGLWHLDGDGTDSSGNGNTMAIPAAPAAPTWGATAAGFGSSLQLDGLDDHGRIPWSASLDTASRITIEAWINKDDHELSVPIVEYNNGAAIGVHLWAHTTGSDLYVNFVDSAGGNHTVMATDVLVEDTWLHVAATYDGSVGRLYLNGEQVAARALGPFTLRTGTGYDVYLGNRPTTPGEFFGGRIDEVRISRVARSAAELRGYYHTRSPHYRVVADSSPTDAPVSMASCADASRCADIVVGASGYAESLRHGARYHARAKFHAGAVWSAWSTPDWFERSTPSAPGGMFVGDASAAAGSSNPTSITADQPRLSWSNGTGTTADRSLVEVVTTTADAVAGLWQMSNSGEPTGSATANVLLFSGAVGERGLTGFDRALRLDGVDDTPWVPWDAPLNVSQLTMEAWIRRDDTTGAVPVLEYNDGLGGTGPHLWSFTGSTDLYANLVDTAGNSHTVSATGVIVAGTWQHVAVTYDGSVGRLYVDGSEVANATLGAFTPRTGSGYNLHVGNRPGDTRLFRGLIDDVRISSVARSAAQIRGYVRARAPHQAVMWSSDPQQDGTSLAACPAAARCADIVYGSTRTSRPLASNGARYHVRGRLGSATNGWSAWSSWDWFETGARSGAPTSRFVHETNAQAGSTNPVGIRTTKPHMSFVNQLGAAAEGHRTQVVTTPLADVSSLWALDQSNLDATANANDLVRARAPKRPSYDAGRAGFGQALRFDGVDDHAWARPDPSFHDPSQLTIEAWINKDDTLEGVPIVEFNNGATHGAHLWNFGGTTEAESGTAVFANFVDTAGADHVVYAVGVVSASRWYHVAATYDGSIGRVYVDGQQVASATLGSFTPQMGRNYAAYLGHRPLGSASLGGRTFRGRIDDVRISRVARTAAEIAGAYRTEAPHYTTLWESSPSDAGDAIASCASAARCADQTLGASGTSTLFTTTPGARYYARSKARSAASSWSAWGGWDWFETANTSPAVSQVSPADGAAPASTPTLEASWTDPDPDEVGRLEFELCSSSTCSSIAQSGTVSSLASGASATWTPSTLAAGSSWWWRARAVDARGAATTSGIRSFRINRPPPEPTRTSPDGPGPLVALVVDGVELGRQRVTASPLANYTFDASIPAGAHTVALNMTNDYYPGEDRNVWFDHISLDGSGAAYEAEAASGTTGSCGTVSSASASGGIYLNYCSTPALSHTLTTVAATTSVTVRMGGDFATHFVTSTTPTFSAIFDDPDAGDTGRIDMRICADAACTTVLESGSTATGLGIGATGTWTATAALVPGTTYWWSASSVDAPGLSSGYTSSWPFIVDRPPDVPELLDPADTSATSDTTPTFSARMTDPDGNRGSVTYQLCADSTCTAAGDPQQQGTSTSVANGQTAFWSPPTAMAAGTWWWRARSTDVIGMAGAWSSTRRLVIGAETITLAVGSASESLGTLLPGDGAVATTTISVTTDSATGYALVSADGSDTLGMSRTGGGGIADWTAGPTTPTPWGTEQGYFGLTLLSATGGKDTTRWGTGTTASDTANLRYAGLASLTTTSVHQRSGYSAATDTIVTSYRALTTSSQAAGSYSTTVTYTATALP